MKTYIFDFDGVFVKPLNKFWDTLELVSNNNNILRVIHANESILNCVVDVYLEWCYKATCYEMLSVAQLLRSYANVAVCTNNFHKVIDTWSKHFGIKFDYVYSRKGENEPKPSPKGIFEILKHVGGPAIMVGDEVVDKEAARAAGIPFALAGWFNPLPIEADVYFENPFDIVRFALKLEGTEILP